MSNPTAPPAPPQPRPPSPDPGDLAGFMRPLLADRPASSLVTLPDGKARHFQPSELSAAVLYADRRNRGGSNVYWLPGELLEPVPLKPKKIHVARLDWLFVDWDPTATDPQEVVIERAEALLRILATDPDIIIDSGNGYQAYWRVLSAFEGDEALAQAEDLIHAIALALGGDPSVADCSRILRLPGTVNIPNKAKLAKGRVPRLARMLRATWDRRRSVEEILANIPGAAEALERYESRPRAARGPGVAARRGARGCPDFPPPITAHELEKFPPGAWRIAWELTDSHGRPYPSRGRAAFAFARSCGREYFLGKTWLTPEMCARALLTRPLGAVALHFLDYIQITPKRTERELWRTVLRAYDAAEQSIAAWRRKQGGPQA